MADSKKLYHSEVVTHQSGPGMGQNVDCEICLEVMSAEDDCSTHALCRKSFHQKCLRRWLQQPRPGNLTGCPSCRQIIESHQGPPLVNTLSSGYNNASLRFFESNRISWAGRRRGLRWSSLRKRGGPRIGLEYVQHIDSDMPAFVKGWLCGRLQGASPETAYSILCYFDPNGKVILKSINRGQEATDGWGLPGLSTNEWIYWLGEIK